MRRFLIIILFLILITINHFNVNAQTDVTIDQMQVKIWPEYDKPSILVINNIFLSGDVKLPARINFSIPISAGPPHSVAVRELDGQLYLLDYDMTQVGDWNQLTFTSPYPEVWIEYYDPSITINENVRSFEYQWVGDYLINNLQIEVQQPLTASNMVFKESMGPARIGNDGLTYYSSEVGELKANTKVSLNLQYNKSDSTLSSSVAVPVQPVTPLNTEAGGSPSFIQILPFIIAGIGLAMLIFGVFWYMRKQKENLTKPRQRHTSIKRSSHNDGEAIFCHRCGRRADSGDVFCRSCGTKLKMDE
ncbi:MAG TPA: zinc ribbon domain-containing protein [Anaerolineaceae bacterium]|nr:zinc ribbon domain-containing protein [Anaerolineaceae bacterium]